MATGTVEETIEYCRRTLDTIMPDGGFCFAPTHQLQDNSPTESVIAIYATAWEYGKYCPVRTSNLQKHNLTLIGKQ